MQMPTLTPGSILGHAVRRREDPRLITGAGHFVDDIRPERCLHVALVRSTLAHARIRSLDVAAAAGAPGVVAVLTGNDLRLPARVGFQMVPETLARPPLATERVRFVGEPVALVVAGSPGAAEDAAQLLGLHLEPLAVVVDPEAARRPDAPLLFPSHGSNVANRFDSSREDDVFAGAEVKIRGRFVNQRLAPVPMEAEAILVVPEAGRLLVWATSQTPFGLRAEMASSLGMSPSDIRVVVGDMGGGFGAKAGARPELIVVAAAARKLGRPVKWIETRSENLVAMTHGRGQVQDVELGAMHDGHLVGMRARVVADVGAYPGIATLLPMLTGQMASGVYSIPAIDYEAQCVVTNTTPLGAYRGAGRPEATAMVERAMDMLAAELGMDPADLRRRNLISPDRFPYTTAGGATYDSGDYAKALDKLLEVSAYRTLRTEQARRRERGDRLQGGIGLSVYVEVTAVGVGPECGAVGIETEGTASVR